MVVRLEDRVAAAASPALLPPREQHALLSTASYEGSRYAFYAVDALLVVLYEPTPHVGIAVPSNPRTEAKRCSQLELWQVWDARDRVTCVRFNTTTKRVARGALALCLDEGRVALLTPTSAASHLPTAAPPAPAALTRTASRLTIKTGDNDVKPVSSATRRASLFGGAAGSGVRAAAASGAGSDVTREYVKVHLQLQLPTWQESIRWKADDDRAMDRIEWVESGDDLWLVGAGEKITTWKLVEESGVVAYQQLSFVIGEPEQRAWHMDVTPTGRFVATAGEHDRVLKLWSLQELAHDGTPVCLFLAHRRALVSATWAKSRHMYKLQGATQCEMLYTLDRAGTVSIWRENMASPGRAFTLWKTITTQDIAMRMPTLDGDESSVELSPLQSWGLVVNDWGRQVPHQLTAFTETLLEEGNVMAALSQFHYGYTSLDEVRRNELLNQRMDNIPKANSKLLGGRTGAAADSHAGETFICGNLPLHKTFLVHLGFGVHANGDLSLFRLESIPSSGVSPKLSLLCMFSGLKEQLMGATTYTASSADYKDRENGSVSFFLELLFQPREIETHLKVARLKLQVESGGFRSSRANVAYSVQMCEVGDASPSLMSAYVPDSSSTSSLPLTKASATPYSGSSGHLPVVNQGGQVDVLRAGTHLGAVKVVSRARDLFPSSCIKPTHTAQWPSQKVLFAFSDGRLHATSLWQEQPPGISGASVTGNQPSSSVASKMLFIDDDAEEEGIAQLIVCGVSASQKKAWSAAPTSFFFATAAVDTPVVLKDFCVVVGLKHDRQSLIVWVFSVDPPASANEGEVAVVVESTSPFKLYRRVCVDVPDTRRVLRIAATPSLDSFETLFVSVSEESPTLSLWGFSDMDDMSSLHRVHSTELTPMLTTTPPRTEPSAVSHDMMQFSFSEVKHDFRDIAVSACGRVALLFEEATSNESSSSNIASSGTPQPGGDFSACIVSLFDTWHESVIKLPRKKYGQILSIKWTPPLTPSLDCQLVFLSATTVGIAKVDASSNDGAWSVAWSSSRLSTKPRLLSDMDAFPQAYLSLGTSIADLNLADIAGSSLVLAPPVAGPGSLATLPTADVATNATHPITLLFLLMRGSFTSLDHVFRHIKESIADHEKACYMKMLEDQELNHLPLMKLELLLGKDAEKDERSDTFTKGKGKSGSSGGGSSATVSSRASLARASDLFAMDFGSVRRSSLALGLSGGESMFGSSSLSASAESPVIDVLGLEGNELSAFFVEHSSSLTFLPEGMRTVFLDIMSGSKKIVAWEKDTSRSKDEPTLRFAASLLWPYKPDSPIQMSPPVDGESDESAPEQVTSPQSSTIIGGICSEQVAWAALSDYQSELLQECFPSPAFTLQDLSQLRLPFWLKSSAKLAQFTEKAAQAEYASTRDPFRVALLYVLLGKTKLLISLFKMGSEPKIADLLANDFSDPRWKNAAVKNAYVLKAKRRHELSATFFLLGGKVQEAMSVAEHADPTLVLSFLIARLSEKWDLSGGDGQGDSFSGGYGDVSFTGLSSNMRTFDAMCAGVDSGSNSDSCKDICKEYLKSTVWMKSQSCGDVFMAFLVKYLTGETASALQALLTVPSVDVTCMFEPALSSDPKRGLYWRVFGQSLSGASELVRYMRPTIPRMTAVMKVQAVQLQAISLNRLFAMGCNVAAMFQQRDSAGPFKQFCKENPPRSAAVRAAFLAARGRIFASLASGQSTALSGTAVNSLERLLAAKSGTSGSSLSLADVLEDRIDDEIQCLVSRGGSFEMDDVQETQNAAVVAAMRQTVLDTLHQAGRTSLEEFVYAHWFPPQQLAIKGAGSPLHTLLDAAIDGVAIIAAGDLAASATTSFHSKHVDQICSELLNIAEKLLHWLAYLFHGKRPQSQTASGSTSSGGSSECIRVVAGSIYSIICVCSRYVKTPCCLYRTLSAVFPHIDVLPKKTLDDIKEIALADVCVYCSAAKGVREETPRTGLPSLQRHIPVLYQIVQMLQQNLNTVVEEVRTNRLELAPPTLFYSYCQYWTLVLCIAASTMPAHITKVAVDGANPHAPATLLAKKLVQTWSLYASNLAKCSSQILLCEITESYFRPFSMRPPSTPTGSTPSTPKDSSSTSGSAAPSTAPSTSVTSNLGGVPIMSPLGRDRRESRQLLRCTCDRCPWLLILKMFADKDELLLRLNSQLECCSEKIKEEISWGHLPDFPSKKAALTRSQKILLSNAAAGKGPELSDLLEKRILQGTSSIQLEAHCIYRSDVSIKNLCFNHATETAELVLCSSKGICRTASVEYSDGTKYQFKGMYAAPQASLSSESVAPNARRKTADASGLTRATTDNSPRGGGETASTLADAKAPSFKPTAVESHPFLPLFVSGNQKGKVHLWSYESLSAVCEFQTKDVVTTYALGQSSSSRRDIKKIRFDSLGQQMGAVDSLGRLCMWKFANLDREPWYRVLDCHDKGAKSLQFINSSTIVATVGSSSDKRSVCMWDLLLPNSKAQIAAPACHSAGAASLTFSPTHQLLISGGEGGSISVFDVRQRRVLHTITNAHETAITTLELHPSGRCVLSGSASGDVKIWSLPIFRELVAVSKVHAKPSFLGDAASNLLGDAASNMAINVTNSSWGVTDAFATDDYFFTSGTDGSVQRFRMPSLGKIF